MAVVVVVGDIFKNGFVGWVVEAVVEVLSATTVSDDFKLLAARTLLSNFGDVISVLKILSDGTLILSIAPCVSEKWVTVTFSLKPFSSELG